MAALTEDECVVERTSLANHDKIFSVLLIERTGSQQQQQQHKSMRRDAAAQE